MGQNPMRRDNLAASLGSSPGRDSKCVRVTLLLLAAVLSPAMVAAQRTPQPVFTELFAYDPATPSQLLRKWLISGQLDSKQQPLRRHHRRRKYGSEEQQCHANALGVAPGTRPQ